jgi:hypothetical protein
LGLGDSVVDLVGRVGPSWLFPSLGVGHSGTAYLCTSDHVPIYFEGMTHTPDPVHVDVSMKLWNKTHRAMTIFEPKRARAAGQDLRWDEPNYIGSFNEATLSSDGSTAEQHFRLRPPEGIDLVATSGDRLTLDLRRNRGKRVRVHLKIATER